MTEIFVNDFIKGLLIFVRISGLIFTAPIFNNRGIPTLVRVFLSLVIAYVVFFNVEDISYQYSDGLLPLALMAIKEMITGLIMGFMLNFVFQGIAYAGTLIGFDMGIAMAQAFDPTMETNTNVVGQALSFLAFLIFLMINGHHYVIRALTVSFEVIPVGFYTISEPVVNLLIKYSAGIFVLAVKIASPMIVSFLLINIASGIVARVIPQMNVFFVLHPVKMILGFLLFISTVPIYAYFFKNLLINYENKLLELVRIMGT